MHSTCINYTYKLRILRDSMRLLTYVDMVPKLIFKNQGNVPCLVFIWSNPIKSIGP